MLTFAKVRQDFTVAINGVVHLPGTLLALGAEMFIAHKHKLEDVTDDEHAALSDAVEAAPGATVVAVGTEITTPAEPAPAAPADPAAPPVATE